MKEVILKIVRAASFNIDRRNDTYECSFILAISLLGSVTAWNLKACMRLWPL